MTNIKLRYYFYFFITILVGLLGLSYLVYPQIYEEILIPYANISHQVMLMIHASTGGLALILGVWQFNDSWRAKRRQLFRRLGIAYTCCVTVSAVTGIYVAFFAEKALLVGKIGFIMLSLMWLYTLYMGVTSVKEKNFKERREWFMRNFSLTLAAVTLRIYLGIFIASVNILGAYDVIPLNSDADFDTYFNAFYPVLGWLCWVPNILFVEYRYIVPKNSKLFKQKQGK